MAAQLHRFDRISAREWMHGYRAAIGDGRVVEVVRSQAVDWGAWVGSNGAAWVTLAHRVPYRVAMRAARDYLATGGEWSADNSAAASAEGWDVSDNGGTSEDGSPLLERVDDMDTFDDDPAAWVHVVARALDGSPLHCKALAVIRTHNVAEYDRMMAHTAATGVYVSAEVQ